jgi:hypothetical protein
LIFAAFHSTNHPDTATTNLTDSCDDRCSQSKRFSGNLSIFWSGTLVANARLPDALRQVLSRIVTDNRRHRAKADAGTHLPA